MCRLCQFNIGASLLMTPIFLICTGTQLGFSCLSTSNGEKNCPCRFKEGELDRTGNGQREVGTVPVQHALQALCFGAKQCFGNVRILTFTCGLRDSAQAIAAKSGKKGEGTKSLSRQLLTPGAQSSCSTLAQVHQCAYSI